MAALKDWGWGAPQAAGWLWVPAVLVLLYLFRPRHRPQAVAAAFLWRQVHDRLGGQSLWRRLQNQRLLWLQLLFCALAILALLRPFQIRPGLVAPQVVLLLDTSASMTAGTPTRFESVRREAQAIVDQAPSGTEFLLARLDHDLAVLASFTQDRASLRSQLAALQPRALRGRDEQVTAFVLSLRKTNPQAQLHWFSDHALSDAVCHLADQGRINYAIESFQSTPDQLFVAVRNYHKQAGQVRLAVSGARGFRLERQVSLRGGGRQLLQLPLAGSWGGPWRADLLDPDDMDLDNHAFCLASDRTRLRLYSHGTVSPFLEQAAQAASGLPLLRASEESAEGIHLWAELPESLPPGRHLAGKAPASWLAGPDREDEGPLLLPSELQQKWRFRLTSQRWGRRQSLRPGLREVKPVLVDSEDQPLVVERASALVWLFSLEDSDLPLSPELPVLLSAWLRDQSDPSRNLGLLCGKRLRFAGPGELSGPRGREVLSGPGWEWCPAWPGLYSLNKERDLAVNFHSPEESDLDKAVKVTLGPRPGSDPELHTRPMSQEYTLPLIALALLVLLVEYRVWWGWRPRC